MNAEIIAAGSELLTPARSDTNSLWLTARLNELGVEVTQKTIVGDDRDRLAAAMSGALERVEIVKRIRQFTADTSYKLGAATWGARRHQFVTRRPRVTMFGA